jgi:Na+-translocating ferredoxin:NAD+ oxidoreductase RnfA subunit
MNILQVIFTAMIGGNLVLTTFVDISLMRNLRKLDVAFFVGLMMIDVAVVSGISYYLIYIIFLGPLGFEFLGFLVLVLLIAGVTSLEAWILKRFLPTWYETYSFYMPLVSVNAVITLTLMQMMTGSWTFWDVVVSSLAVPAGFVMITMLMVIFQERLEKTSRIPKPFQGLSMTFILLALIAMALLGFGG